MMGRGVALLLLAGCIDNEVTAITLDNIAVVLGDFDDVSDPLTSLTIGTTPYDGFIVQATYDPEEDRRRRNEMDATVEELLTDSEGELDLLLYNAVFVNSGTRGLNLVQYNNPLEPDDSLLRDAEALQQTCDYANGNNTLVASDWAYDLIEFCWPDAIEFYGDDLQVDAAQAGLAVRDLPADVVNEGIAGVLGPTVNLDYNYTAWAVIEGVGAETEVLLRGSVEYQPSASDLPESLSDVPLMVRFPVGRSGQVVFSTFHWNVQTPAVAQALLLQGVEGLQEGSGSSGDTAGEGGS